MHVESVQLSNGNLYARLDSGLATVYNADTCEVLWNSRMTTAMDPNLFSPEEKGIGLVSDLRDRTGVATLEKAKGARRHGNTLISWSAEGDIAFHNWHTGEQTGSLRWPGRSIKDVRTAGGRVLAVASRRWEQELGLWNLNESTRFLDHRTLAEDYLRPFADFAGAAFGGVMP